MTKKFLCLLSMLFIGYISCAIGAEVIPDQDIVKINGINIYHDEAIKFLKYIKVHENPQVSYIDDVNINIENSDFMYLVRSLYSSCEEELKNDEEICKKSSRKLGPRVVLKVDLNKDKKIITELAVIR